MVIQCDATRVVQHTGCGVSAVRHLPVMGPRGDCPPPVGRVHRRSFGRPAAGIDHSGWLREIEWAREDENEKGREGREGEQA